MGRSVVRSSKRHARWGLLVLLAALPAMFGCPKSDDPVYYINKLQSSDEETQRRAVEELVRMNKRAMPYITGRKPGESEKTLPAAIDSENPNVRKGCADFLAKVRRMESLVAVGELIDDPDREVRLKAIEAVSALAQVWRAKSIALLRQAFQDEDPECVEKAGEGLRNMRAEEATEVLREFYRAGKGIQAVYAARFLYESEPDPELARPILEGLISDEKAVREAANLNLKALKEKLVAPLVHFIDTTPRVARAVMSLEELRNDLIQELDVILDSKRAADILMALGEIADQASINKLNHDLNDAKLESTWRVAAARALARAASSARTTSQQKAEVRSILLGRLDDEKEDTRIRIGAAIALCQLRERRAVEYLLDELSAFDEAINKPNVSEARIDDLTQLRIWSQEALTSSGEFVVSFLMDRIARGQKALALLDQLRASREAVDARRLSPELRRALAELGINAAEALSEDVKSPYEFLVEKVRALDPGPIIRWAAAKTFGELGTREAIPYLADLATSTVEPMISIGPDGAIEKINGGKPLDKAAAEELKVIFPDAEEGAVPDLSTMKPWKDLSEEEAAKVEQMLEVFRHPDYVRWTSALALGSIGGPDALAALHEAERMEKEFHGRLAKSRELKDYYLRANVLDALIARHEDVLFYIRRATEKAEAPPQGTGS